MQPALALLCVGTDVLADEDGGRIDVERQPDGLADDAAAAHDERSAPQPQRGVEIAERFDQEGDPVRRPERREHGVVEDEQRHDVLRPVDGSGERRLVVQTQVTREEHDDGAVFAHLDKG